MDRLAWPVMGHGPTVRRLRGGAGGCRAALRYETCLDLRASRAVVAGLVPRPCPTDRAVVGGKGEQSVDELAWVLVYVGAAWPVVLVVPSLLPRWKRGRVSERRWILCFSGYALLLTLAAILHAYVLTDSRPAPTALAYVVRSRRPSPARLDAHGTLADHRDLRDHPRRAAVLPEERALVQHAPKANTILRPFRDGLPSVSEFFLLDGCSGQVSCPTN